MGKDKHRYEFGSGSDVGCVRTENEDSYVLYRPRGRRQRARKGYLLAVCDGMGGAVGGRTASDIAAETIPEIYYGSGTAASSQALSAAIKEASRRIYKRAESDPELSGMGTTAVAVALQAGEAHLAHVGDSRCYLVRDGAITRVTEDHTVVSKMVQEGLLTPEQAASHPESHILNRSVGVMPDVEVDVHDPPIRLRRGDVLILCSDGLSNPVADNEISEVARRERPQQAAEALIALARERGGPDNVTVMVARILGDEEPPPEPSKTIARRPPRRRRRPLRWGLWLLLIALLAAGALYLAWSYGLVDLGFLPDWVPTPPPLQAPPEPQP